MPYDVTEIRNKLKKSMSGRFRDPDEFRPDKLKDNDSELNYRFFVLGPVMKGDTVKSGIVQTSMDQFFCTHADHWFNNQPTPCPRVYGFNPGKCEICEFGFSLIKAEKDQEAKKKLVKEWMPTTYYTVNVYFPAIDPNPEDLRGKVKYYKAPKTVFDTWVQCLNRENAGDAADPKAFGVFFDENASFLYQLTIRKKGNNNNYETSKFLPNKGIAIPISKGQDKIAAILGQRFDLFTKIEKPDPAKIKKLYATVVDGNDSSDDTGDGFDVNESTDTPVVETAPAKAKTSTATAKATSGKPSGAMRTAATQTTSPKANPKQTAAPVQESEIDVDGGDDLASESPFEGESGSSAVTAGASDDAVSNSEIQDLLSQLDDE